MPRSRWPYQPETRMVRQRVAVAASPKGKLGQALVLGARGSLCSRTTRGRRFVQGSIQAQPGDADHAPPPRPPAQGGKAALGNPHQFASSHPSAGDLLEIAEVLIDALSHPAARSPKGGRAASRRAACRPAASRTRRAAAGAPRQAAGLPAQQRSPTICGRHRAASTGGIRDRRARQR